MKTTPEQYANDLIEKHSLYSDNSIYYDKNAIQCAIIDVSNTIDELIELGMYEHVPERVINEYKKVLEILNKKL